jgi:uncharacterized protein YndB with AHSA1/START domain
MIDESPSHDRLVLTGAFEGYDPSELFAMWVVPDFLMRWWPEVAEVRSGVGGHYKFSWPGRNWILEGAYTAWEPGGRLGFTWKWNFDPADKAEMQVEVLFRAREEGGTDLIIMHSPYSDSQEDQTTRDGHREGWMHFCMRLAGLREGELLGAAE